MADRGLALSTAISASLQVALLAWLIQGRVGRLDWARIGSTAARALVATGAMSAVCLAALWLIPPGNSTLGQAAALAIPIFLGLVTYFAVARWLGLEEPGMLFKRESGTDDCS
jgi:peptidoglycan biosynthesis protein MviN/MurJ (putative lipid II flippase)